MCSCVQYTAAKDFLTDPLNPFILINMQSSVHAIIDELKYLKKQGIQQVYVQEQTLAALREMLGGQSLKAPFSSSEKVSVPSVAHETLNKGKEGKESAAADKHLPDPPKLTLPEGDKLKKLNWLRQKVLNCSVCKEHVKPGKQVVFGVGNPDAKIFFCGEAPGAEEETQGEPFVGPAGQLLTKIIQAMGLERKDVYIANIMNWRPEMPTSFGNRPPTQEEMGFCLPYLRAQVAVVKPKVIVALGATAVNGLLGYDSKRRMGDVRGHWFEFAKTPLMVTYHPSYLLRNDTLRAKRLVWEDMLKVMEKVGMPISAKQRSFFS